MMANRNLVQAMSLSKPAATSSSMSSGSQMSLSELHEGSAGPVTVIVCRKWDVTSVSGRYMSTDYIVSDKKGGTMHCTARSNIAHYFYDKLKEGGVYVLRGFTVLISDQYRILKDNRFVLSLTGSTVVKKVNEDVSLFNRHPFMLTPFEEIQPTEGKYFVDVVGYVTEIGPQIVTGSGARTVEFNLTNERKRQIGVTLWGAMGDAMIKKKNENPAVYSFILTSMSAKFYLGTLGLSSSTSTLVIDSPDVPALETFKQTISCVAVGDVTQPITEEVATVSTLAALIDGVRADMTKKRVIVFRNVLEITSVRTKNSWYFFTCSGTKCRKGLTREGGSFYCTMCKKGVDYPRTRFRIQLDVTDGTMNTVVVLFDEASEQLLNRTAKSLVEEHSQDSSVDAPLLPAALSDLIGSKHVFEIRSHTYYSYGDYESFNYGKIIKDGQPDTSDTFSANKVATDSPTSDTVKRTASDLVTPAKPARKLRKFRVDESDEETAETCGALMDTSGNMDNVEDGSRLSE